MARALWRGAAGAKPLGVLTRWVARPSRPSAERIRITRVGLWFVLVALVIGVAAANTGNNALYLVLATILGLLVVSGLWSRTNVRGLAATVEAPGEIYARRPFEIAFTLTNRGILPRCLLLFTLGTGIAPRLIGMLRSRSSTTGRFELLVARRGRFPLRALHVASLFPLGLFQKGMRYPLEVELLVYPELFPAATRRPERTRAVGEGRRRRVGWGHELHALRPFRRGDDPRGIHWKQTARTGAMVYLEREAEEGRRLSIVLDNFAERDESGTTDRFEQLVSEAATAAVDHLARGFEVELIVRGDRVPFAAGPQQHRRLLEALALIEVTAAGGALALATGSVVLRLVLEPRAA